MSDERKILLTIMALNLFISALVIGLTAALNWSILAITTIIFILAYPQIFFSLKVYSFWKTNLMRLISHSHMLEQGINNSRYVQHPDNLLAQLERAIEQLAANKDESNNQAQSLELLLSQILDNWSVPIVIFDQALQLNYRNKAMNDALQKPLLRGCSATDLGFTLAKQQLTHPLFSRTWQTDTIKFRHNEQDLWLFSALDIASPLHQTQSITQQNLVRVLTHELRNSLTPMASMADTLLSTDNPNPAQVSKVLERIKQRSNGLLEFVGSFSQLAQLPEPNCKWFSFDDLIVEAQSMIDPQVTLTQRGENKIFADRQQLSQVLINLFKNAEQALETPSQLKLHVTLYVNQHQQVLIITDNGPGFANLDNVLTPFYTTKSGGSGIGLSLCAQIINRHGGQLTVNNHTENQQIKGAQIVIHLPINPA